MELVRISCSHKKGDCPNQIQRTALHPPPTYSLPQYGSPLSLSSPSVPSRARAISAPLRSFSPIAPTLPERNRHLNSPPSIHLARTATAPLLSARRRRISPLRRRGHP
uniref:Uncharacterized protein n=1 Tax=Oryza barthii TaxID=65489 RepID=A0A679BCR9_9ORYZ|nr:hypothetical protein [Oryza barthii]